MKYNSFETFLYGKEYPIVKWLDEERIETEAEKNLKEATINALKSSIERRKKLLSNENYVNKAPAKIVELDRQKLEEEKKKLEELMK